MRIFSIRHDNTVQTAQSFSLSDPFTLPNITKHQIKKYPLLWFI